MDLGPEVPSNLHSVWHKTNSVALKWVAPVAKTGAGVSGYVVYRDDGAGGAVTTVAYDGRASTTTGGTVTGLSGGRTYVFAVSAFSAGGEGDRSASERVSTSPAAAAGLRSTAQTTGSVTLAWSAPTTLGDAAVTGYRVYRSDGEGGTTLETVAYDGSKSNSTGGVVSGLAGGRLYSFVVSAFSTSGEGNRSAVISQSTAAPAISNVSSVAQKTTSITLAWSAPNVTTGAAVSTYLVYRNDGVSGAVTTVAYNGSATGATLGGLVGGRTYKLAVSGLSGAGEGDRSATLAQSTAPGVPGTPKSTVQTASAITLSWSAPSTGSGAKVAAYRVYESTSSGMVQRQNTTGATSATVSGLAGGVQYVYVVSALSAAGEGDTSVALNQSTAPALVTNVTSSHQSTSTITLQWAAPATPATATAGAAVKGYKVYRRDVVKLSDLFNAGVSNAAIQHFFLSGNGKNSKQTTWTTDTLLHNTTANETSVAVSGLSGGQLYEFTVSAFSAAGEGQQSTSLGQSTAPRAPSGLRLANVSSSNMTLSWNAPEAPNKGGGAAVQGYKVYKVANSSSSGISSDSYTLVYSAPSDTSTSGFIKGLASSTSYRFVAVAVSGAGTSDVSSPPLSATTSAM